MGKKRSKEAHEEKRLIRFDWAMKNMLRDKANFDILEGFLSALLKIDITIIQILESESNQENGGDKFNRVDLLVEDNKGDRILIEVQNEREVHFLERVLFGSSKLIVENLKLGQPYEKIKKVISISILYFVFGESIDDYLYYGTTDFVGVHSKTKLRLERKEQEAVTTIESKDIFPEYYLIEVKKFQDIINSDLDEWIYFFKNESVRDDFKAKNIDKAKEKLDMLKMNRIERKRYERYLSNLASEKDIIGGAYGDGRSDEKVELIVRMCGEGINLETAAKVAEVSIEQVKDILKKAG
ncbi:MAG: Rpn family recombination-promoting nuclease/putative transposase [bacterium]|nr:Rpn family recombination-promoting nuclease/putative transposase [bacterium]